MAAQWRRTKQAYAAGKKIGRKFIPLVQCVGSVGWRRRTRVKEIIQYNKTKAIIMAEEQEKSSTESEMEQTAAGTSFRPQEDTSSSSIRSPKDSHIVDPSASSVNPSTILHRVYERRPRISTTTNEMQSGEAIEKVIRPRITIDLASDDINEISETALARHNPAVKACLSSYAPTLLSPRCSSNDWNPNWSTVANIGEHVPLKRIPKRSKNFGIVDSNENETREQPKCWSDHGHRQERNVEADHFQQNSALDSIAPWDSSVNTSLLSPCVNSNVTENSSIHNAVRSNKQDESDYGGVVTPDFKRISFQSTANAPWDISPCATTDTQRSREKKSLPKIAREYIRPTELRSPPSSRVTGMRLKDHQRRSSIPCDWIRYDKGVILDQEKFPRSLRSQNAVQHRLEDEKQISKSEEMRKKNASSKIQSKQTGRCIALEEVVRSLPMQSSNPTGPLVGVTAGLHPTALGVRGMITSDTNFLTASEIASKLHPVTLQRSGSYRKCVFIREPAAPSSRNPVQLSRLPQFSPNARSRMSIKTTCTPKSISRIPVNSASRQVSAPPPILEASVVDSNLALSQPVPTKASVLEKHDSATIYGGDEVLQSISSFSLPSMSSLSSSSSLLVQPSSSIVSGVVASEKEGKANSSMILEQSASDSQFSPSTSSRDPMRKKKNTQERFSGVSDGSASVAQNGTFKMSRLPRPKKPGEKASHVLV